MPRSPRSPNIPITSLSISLRFFFPATCAICFLGCLVSSFSSTSTSTTSSVAGFCSTSLYFMLLLLHINVQYCLTSSRKYRFCYYCHVFHYEPSLMCVDYTFIGRNISCDV